MKVLLINEGSARSVNEPETGIAYQVKPIIQEKYGNIPTCEVISSHWGSKSEIKDFLLEHNSYGNDLIIVRKSYGVKELHDIMKKPKNYNKYFRNFKSITDFAIDGYSLFGRIGIGFGLQGKSFKHPKPLMYHHIHNFRQENGTRKNKNGKYKGWLRGARFINADSETILKNSTHSTIAMNYLLLDTIREKA